MLACVVVVAAVAMISALPVLPSPSLLLSALIACGVLGALGRLVPVLARFRQLWGFSMLALFAALWATFWGHQRLDNRLNAALEGVELQVVGTVDSLPVRTERGLRFVLKVESLSGIEGQKGENVMPLAKFPERIRLNWYSDKYVLAGSRLELRVKLKRPHGYVNLGGFDYERWLLSRGIGATGYVRRWLGNQVLQEQGLSFSSIHRVRQEFREKILASATSAEASALAVALVTGDKSAILAEDRTRLQYLGLAHLLAISGLHIGLAAGVGLLLGQGVGRCLNALSPGYCFTPGIAMGCAWGVAASYALLAGLSLPTQRALLMLTVWVLVSLSGRRFSPWFAWWFALAVVFCFFPLSLYDLGLWLSFGAVAILVATFQGRWVGQRARWRQLLWAQAVLFAALGLLQWFAGLPVSLVSPLVNFMVIPYVGILVVPVLLLMTAIAFASAELFELILNYALMPLQFLVWFLDQFESGLLMIADWEFWLWQRSGVATFDVRIAMFSIALLLFSPLPQLLKLLALLGSVSVICSREVISEGLEVVVLDVGQGLSVVIHERERHHLVDVGRDFHVAGVLLPYFQYRGITQLDTVVVSHGDADHAGGLPPLVNSMSAEKLWIRAEDARRWLSAEIEASVPISPCSGKSLSYWGDVRVTRFGVGEGEFDNANDRSCVLLLEYAGVRILLPGDIENGREQLLLAESELSAPVDILMAPHHGSRTSSGRLWVHQLRPRWVVFSAGYRNGYGHPATEVVDRYQRVGASLLNTAELGAVHFTISPKGKVLWNSARNLRKRYWM